MDDADLYMEGSLVRECAEDGIFAGGDSHVDLANCTIDSCGANGLHMPQPASTAKVHSTRMSNCGAYPARLAASTAEA